MKLQKYSALLKKKGYGIWINTPDCVVLALPAAMYKAPGLPGVNELPAIKAILDIDKKAEEKAMVNVDAAGKDSDIKGFDLSDGTTEHEQDADNIRAAAFIDDVIYSVLRTKDGQLLFYDRQLLLPLADKLKDKDASAYIGYFVRKHGKSGQPYIVVKDGFTTLAAIMPVKVLTADYISELQDFELMCIDQLNREKEEQKDDGQMSYFEGWKDKFLQKHKDIAEGQQGTEEPELSEEELQDLADRACKLNDLSEYNPEEDPEDEEPDWDSD